MRKIFSRRLSFFLALVMMFDVLIGGQAYIRGLADLQMDDGIEFNDEVYGEVLDDFNNGYNTAWENDEYDIVDGCLFVRGSESIILDEASMIDLADYSVQAYVRVKKYCIGSEVQNGTAGVAARFNQTESTKTGYVLALASNTYDNRLNLELIRYDGETSTVLSRTAAVGTIGTTCRLRILVYAGTVYGYLNGKLMLEVEDNTYTSGKAGLFAYNSISRFDNFLYCSDQLFYDDFNDDSLQEHGWTNGLNINTSVQNGEYILSGETGNDLDALTTEWGNYTQSVVFEFNDDSLGDPGEIIFTIRGVYELELVADETGDYFGIALYRNQGGRTLLDDQADVGTLGTTHTLKIDVVEDTLTIYLDEGLLWQYIYTVNDTVYDGRIGVSVDCDQLKLSSFSVSRAFARELVATEFVKVTPGTLESAISYDLTAMGLNIGNIALSRGRNGLIMADYDSEQLGEQAIVMSYMSVSTATAVYVDADTDSVLYDTFASGAPAGYWFHDNFSEETTLVSRGWSTDSSVTGTVSDEAYTLKAGKMLYLSNLSGADEWTDYSVEADVTISSEGTLTSGQIIYAGIVGRTSGVTDGYEYRIYVSSTGAMGVDLQRRNAGGSTGAYSTTITRGTAYRLRMVISGTEIDCYLNGVLVIEYDTSSDKTPADGNYFGPYTEGTIGFRSAVASGATISAVYDNVTVMALPDSNMGWRLADGHIDSSGVCYGTVENGVYNIKVRNLINMTAEWTDYSIESDVLLDSDTVNSSECIGIVARASVTAVTGLEFMLVKSGDAAYLRLYTHGGTYAIDTYTTPAIYNMDEVYRLKMQVYGSLVRCYVDDVLVFELTEEDVDLQEGYAGVKCISAEGYVDNVKVAQLAYTGFTLDDQAGALNTTAQNADLHMALNFANVDPIHVMSQDVGATATVFDASTLGESDMTVSYDGDTDSAKLFVVDSTPVSAINSFPQGVIAWDLGGVQSSDKTAIDSLETLYGELTEDDLAHIPEWVIEKYNDLQDELELELYPDLQGYDVTFRDGFTIPDDDWKTVVGAAAGTWGISDGVCTFTSNAYEGASVNIKSQKTMVMTSVSADILLPSENKWTGLLSSYEATGTYHARFHMMANGLVGLDVLRCDNSTYSVLTTFNVSAYVSTGQWHNLRLTNFDGMLKVYLDDTYLGDYDDTANDRVYTEGKAGFRTVESEGTFDNIKVRGIEITDSSYMDEAHNPTEYTDDFEDETVNESPDYWIEKNTVDNWKVYDDDGNKVYGTPDVDWFYDDFSAGTTLVSRGWSTDSSVTGTVSNEAYTLKAGKMLYLSNLSGADEWTDYSVEADVTISSEGTLTSGQTIYAGIVGRTSGSTDGYEYRIYVSGTGAMGVDLQRRGAGGSTGAYNMTITRGTGYHLKMEFSGSNIKCYIDGDLVIDYSNTYDTLAGPYSAGFIGLRSAVGGGATISAVYDNITVMGPQDLDDETNVHTYSSYLHVFEKNPVMTAKFMVTSATAQAKFGFMIRVVSDTTYVRAGYNMDQSKWYVQATQGIDFDTQYLYAENTSAFNLDTWYTVSLVATGNDLVLCVNDNPVLTLDNVEHDGYGRVGVYSNGAGLRVDDVSCTFPDGGYPTDGVVEFDMIPDVYSGSPEVEEIGENTILTVSDTRKFISSDGGVTFTETYDYSGVNAGGGYSSILKLRNGKFMQVLSSDHSVEISTNNMSSWTEVGQVVPTVDQKDEYDRRLTTQHVGSLTEIVLDEETIRLFMPIAFRMYSVGGTVTGHYTRVYYSDNEGVTWTESSNDIRDVYPDFTSTTSWAESKIIKCADGTLRMYYSRNQVGKMAYTVSEDDGVTWEGFYTIEGMECSMSSFGIAEDPYNRGTFYMAYVNSIPYCLGSVFPRANLVLMKSTDGKSWTSVATLDRFSPVIGEGSYEIYQILDPSVLVTEDYVFVGYSRSVQANDEEYHNEQRARYMRVNKTNGAT